jgi:protein-S-isoprenylcysteine O-methyltransferase Ste14
MNSSPWWRNSRGESYVLVQLLLMLLVLFGPTELPGIPRWGAPWATVTLVSGLVLGGVGLVLTALGTLALGNRNLSAFPRPKDGAGLVTTGAYAIVRHPIYSGVSLMSLGWALARRSPLTLGYAFMLLIFFDIKSRREEQWLQAKFLEYAEYRSRVKKLIPFIY